MDYPFSTGYPQLRFDSDKRLRPLHSGDMKPCPPGLVDVLADHEGVISTSDALRFMTANQLRWQLSSGRWQKAARGVVVAQSGPLTDGQNLRAALLRAGPQAVLAGLTAARLDGLTGFGDKASFAESPIHLLVPYGYKRRTSPLRLWVITHYSQALDSTDVHPTRQPTADADRAVAGRRRRLDAGRPRRDGGPRRGRSAAPGSGGRPASGGCQDRDPAPAHSHDRHPR